MILWVRGTLFKSASKFMDPCDLVGCRFSAERSKQASASRLRSLGWVASPALGISGIHHFLQITFVDGIAAQHQRRADLLDQYESQSFLIQLLQQFLSEKQCFLFFRLLQQFRLATEVRLVLALRWPKCTTERWWNSQGVSDDFRCLWKWTIDWIST